MAAAPAPLPAAVAGWWEDMNGSPAWQDGIFYALAVLYGLVAATSFMCFVAFDKEADLDVLDHPVLNFIYYLLVEILPSTLVLYILRRIPSKLRLAQYQQYQPLSSG
ncbi:hypothetical protein PR202_gb09384 [Eleusine coracana subsp. coracana]|uniref:THH1/TOM1/TOM3 domain-containing protein n=1 Tax=Eleusine coracana subsp. coracana TaxID=191504 RepID=A0AAV5EHM9_ELECO|nr:hypothetical protein PR202_gb09384 [Eleusine coracana subsp. coracana]